MKYTLNEISCKGLFSQYCDIAKTDYINKGYFGILLNTELLVKESQIQQKLSEMAEDILLRVNRTSVMTTANLSALIDTLKKELLNYYSEKELCRFSATVFFMTTKQMMIAQSGNNRIFHVKNGEISKLLTDKDGTFVFPSLLSGEGILFATDGMWMPLREEEILIDNIKSQKAEEWLNYLKTRIASRLVEDSDSFAGIAVLAE